VGAGAVGASADRLGRHHNNQRAIEGWKQNGRRTIAIEDMNFPGRLTTLRKERA
jgi:hypothetical protein